MRKLILFLCIVLIGCGGAVASGDRNLDHGHVMECSEIYNPVMMNNVKIIPYTDINKLRGMFRYYGGDDEGRAIYGFIVNVDSIHEIHIMQCDFEVLGHEIYHYMIDQIFGSYTQSGVLKVYE